MVLFFYDVINSLFWAALRGRSCAAGGVPLPAAGGLPTAALASGTRAQGFEAHRRRCSGVGDLPEPRDEPCALGKRILIH